MNVAFYFDFVSPYAYLAWGRLKTLQQETDIEVEFKPILFAVLLNHWGHKGPAELPSKRDYVFKHCARIARRTGVQFTLPKYHPFNPVTALRLCLPEVSGDRQAEMIDCLWHAAWQLGLDLSDKEVLLDVVNAHGFAGTELLARTQDPAVKAALKANTDAAIAADIFGVPTLIVDEHELFWGLDALEDVKAYVQGEDISAAELARTITREVGATR